LREELNGLSVYLDRSPVQTRRYLQNQISLRRCRIIAQGDLPPRAESLLRRLNLNIKVVMSEGECLAIERKAASETQVDHP